MCRFLQGRANMQSRSCSFELSYLFLAFYTDTMKLSPLSLSKTTAGGLHLGFTMFRM